MKYNKDDIYATARRSSTNGQALTIKRSVHSPHVASIATSLASNLNFGHRFKRPLFVVRSLKDRKLVLSDSWHRLLNIQQRK